MRQVLGGLLAGGGVRAVLGLGGAVLPEVFCERGVVRRSSPRGSITLVSICARSRAVLALLTR